MYLCIFVGNLHIAKVALEFLDIGEELLIDFGHFLFK
jgi:hypothetical protein